MKDIPDYFNKFLNREINELNKIYDQNYSQFGKGVLFLISKDKNIDVSFITEKNLFEKYRENMKNIDLTNKIFILIDTENNEYHLEIDP